ncbi:hypothetical protein C8J56DRAFT_916849 [Mycena floridula]|nr:hypothetical protein C8J56DRAFT_916849 [Mycena floridula]
MRNHNAAGDSSSENALWIETTTIQNDMSDVDSPSSLFSLETFPTAASRHAPGAIAGLFFDPSIELEQGIARKVTEYCLETYFNNPDINQIMLFGRADANTGASGLVEISPAGLSNPSPSGIPPQLLSLLTSLSILLKPCIPAETHELLFPSNPTRARQAILNLYHPGEGISPHVDLLGRFGDGIVGVSLQGGCVMRFSKCNETTEPEFNESDLTEHHLYLPPRSVIVLSESARYDWAHGIDKKTEDLVASLEPGGEPSILERGVRLSITFRWLLPGAEVVGDESL